MKCDFCETDVKDEFLKKIKTECGKTMMCNGCERKNEFIKIIVAVANKLDEGINHPLNCISTFDRDSFVGCSIDEYDELNETEQKEYLEQIKEKALELFTI
jgi:hypothetical protein